MPREYPRRGARPTLASGARAYIQCLRMALPTPLVAGIDLGGTAINYTFVDGREHFLIEALCEHPALSQEGPAVCLRQIAEGLTLAADRAGVALADLAAVGLD